MMEILAAGSIYLGDAITHASERALIARLVTAMDRAGTPYVVIANCHFSGRQIDCILATGQSVVVIEAKASHWPVRGDINGHWARLQPNGGEVTYRNAYSQALDARYALRDAMSAGGSLGSWHPDASVVFTTGIPPGSRLTAGDDKVWIGALADLDLGITAKGSPWPLERWHAFARHHRLIAVSYDQAIAPPELIESFRLLDEFRNAVRCEYMRDGRRWIAESDEAHDALIGAVLAVPGMYLAGPSGCGKTLFARRAAAELAANGTTVMYLSARLYDGSWQTLVRRELSLLTGVSPDILYRAVRRTGAPVAIILDGLNELPDADDALRGLRALAKRLDAGLFVTGQADAPPQLAALERVAIGRPSFALKKRIAATGENFSDVGLEALKAVTSGYEAAVIGSIAATVEHNPSRQGLLDLYVRERLGAHARLGALGLRRLAADLHSALAFSVSESGFDEAMFALNIPDDACTAMFTADLLVRRAGRVSFAHELLQHACAAHGLEISVSRDPATWAILLGAPIYEDIAGDVLSVIESGNVATAILAGSRRPALLHAAMLGSHGAIAQAAAVALTTAAYQAAFAEIADLSLSVVENERTRITWNPDSLRNWTDEEKARLIAAGLDLNSDHGVERHMALYRAMDARLYDERLRVFDEAKAAGCHRLRSAAFELAYLGFGSETGVLHYSRAVRHGADEPDRPIPAREFDVSRLSSGQLHFYLERRYSLVPESGREAFAEQLIYCLEHRFAMEPYHVKLAILNAAGFARTASDEVTERLIGAVQALEVAPGNLGIGSAVTDALQFLGALEDPDDEYRRHVRSDIAFATHGVAEIERCERALMLTGAQFDHPYGEIYYDEIEKLPEETRRTLYRRAVAADTKYCGNLAWIVRQIVAWNDVNDTARMQRLAHLPDLASFMPQEEWSAFVDAVRFLGRHGIALDSVSAETDAGRCLALVRNLVHAAEDRANGASHAATAWLELRTMPVGHAIGALGEVQRALSESHWSESFNPIQHLNLMTSYSQESLFLARAFLDAHAEAVYSHRSVFHDVGPQFAFNAIALLGDRSDLARLRAHSLGPHAHSALATLKRLDQVAS